MQVMIMQESTFGHEEKESAKYCIIFHIKEDPIKNR